jgi:glycosyltransferase involved in cell wall biosynthesis
MKSIIIPYRNREEHLSILFPALLEKFKDEKYEIIVAEQDDNEKFRLSSLYNIAYKYTSGDIIIFHDVDYVPTDNVSYQLKNNNPTYPVRQVVFLNSDLTFKDTNQIPAGYRHFKDDVGNHWGGVFMLHKNHFELINGFNPLYIGWGKEEEETHLRLLEKGLICERNNEGLFYALDHKDNCPLITDYNFIENHHLLSDYKNNLHIGYKNITADVEQFKTDNGIKWLKIKNFKYENTN